MSFRGLKSLGYATRAKVSKYNTVLMMLVCAPADVLGLLYRDKKAKILAVDILHRENMRGDLQS